MMMNVKEFMKRRDIRKPLFILGISAATVFAEIIRELNTFCVRRYEIETEKLEQDLKIVFLSDLHGKSYGINNYKLIYAVRKEHPDIILVGGDMLTRRNASSDVIAYELMQNLVKIAPVYLSNGNHEQKMRENPKTYKGRYAEYKDALENMGIHVLENDSVAINWKGKKIIINGLEIPVKCYTHFKDVPLKVEEIAERIGSADEDSYQILMAHTPVYLKEYKDWGADLSLSGHLHGGIIRLPIIGGIITPQAKLFPKYSGDIYRDGQHYSVVSRGLGTHTVNIRYMNSAELVSIILKPKSDNLC